MDSSTIDHSDSDSGESWTIIENDSNNAGETSEIPDAVESIAADNDKDDDTDGISIITDSEPDSSSPCQINYEHLHEEDCAQMLHIPEFIDLNHEPDKEDDDFLSESGRNDTWNRKTYVHRRNKRLSTVLDIIMLGSVIITAGVAIGHLWGAKTDCSTQAPTNVNKILSNLYKLQEENAYLWSKLKELTALNNYQMTQQKTTLKQNKCKKMFEEPLINNDGTRVTKCVDDKFFSTVKLINNPIVEAAKNDKSDEFLNETEDLANERKSYAESLKDFENVKTNKYLYDSKKILKRPYEPALDSIFSDIDNLVHMNKEKPNFKTNKKQEGDYGYEFNVEDKNQNRDSSQQKKEHSFNDGFTRHEGNQYIKQKENRTIKAKKREVSGQDEFNNKREFTKTKKDKNQKNENKIKTKCTVGCKEIDTNKLSNNKNQDTEKNIIEIKNKDFNKEKKIKDYNVQQNNSEEDVKKDDRYVNQKQKPKLKKNSKHQKNKKNKKRNKYEQWEMKGGLLRDYDDVSLELFQDKYYLLNEPQLVNDKIYTHQSGHNNNIDNGFDATTDKVDDEYIIDDSKNIKADYEKGEINWLDKRARLRKEARQKLEQESLGKNGGNAAGWYFRRMQKREQSRGKNYNSTLQKILKPTINYKLKH